MCRKINISGQRFIYPCVEKFNSEDFSGVDYKILEEDIPLFWKKRINEINRFDIDKNKFIENRLKAVFNMINLNYTTPHIFDGLVKEKILDVWKRSYNIS